MTLQTVEQPVAVVMVQVGNEWFPEYTDPRCHTCMSPHRHHLENAVMRGEGYAAIGRMSASLNHEGKAVPSFRSVSRHIERRHAVHPVIVRRKILEDRAKQTGLSVVDADTLLDHVAVVDVVIRQGFEMMGRGELKPSMGDLLNAVRFKQTIEETSQQGYTHEVWESIFFAVYDTASRVLSEGDFAKLDQAIQDSPMIKMLVDKAQGKGQDIRGETHNAEAS